MEFSLNGCFYLCGAAVRREAGFPLSRVLNLLYKILWNFLVERSTNHTRITQNTKMIQSYIHAWKFIWTHDVSIRAV